VRRQFGATQALAGVDLTAAAGEAIALFGPNGAGKTTLLRIVATLLRPSSGTLRLFGRRIGDGGSAARRRIGLLSHQSFLYPDLTPIENLEFYARMFGAPQQRVRQLLDAVGLLGWAHRPVRTLSRGLEQRCAVARVLLHTPALLLLDEPFTGLDVDATAGLARLLRDVNRDGTTLLLTTHDLRQGLEVCTRAVVLVRGAIVSDAPVAPAEHAAFLDRYRDLTHADDEGALATAP
jgi:heme exporter protein A